MPVLQATDPTDPANDRAWTIFDALDATISADALGISEQAGRIAEQLRTGIDPEPVTWRLLALHDQAHHLTEILAHALGHAVAAMRAEGATWQHIADMAGTSRQAAHDRWASFAPAAARNGQAE